jgi:hypothetical protein
MDLPGLDHVARERAESALETARSAWEGVGSIMREVAGLRSEIREGFARMERKLGSRASKADLHEVEEELENSKVLNLRRELAALKKQRHDVAKWFLVVAAGVAVAAICTWLGFHPR